MFETKPRLKAGRPLSVDSVRKRCQTLAGLSADGLLQHAKSLKSHIVPGQSDRRLANESFALASEAIRRVYDIEPYDVQIEAAGHLIRERIVEMATGEGKTLTAILPIVHFAMFGRGCHLITANDYLAARDAEYARPVFELLGLNTASVTADSEQRERKQAYQADATYVTASELGFDYLRDQLEFGPASTRSEPERTVKRPFFALIDEADNILIDEANTPLIIGGLDRPAGESQAAALRWAASIAPGFQEGTEYRYESRERKVVLLMAGRAKARSLESDPQVRQLGWGTRFEMLERAILVLRTFRKDEHYVVRDGEVVIVDEFTGRFGEGRRWQAGIHQAIEAKEGLEVTGDHGQAARITIQDLFMSYPHFAGMTGTAHPSQSEFSKVYRRKVIAVPTRLPSKRHEWRPRRFRRGEEKLAAVVESVRELNSTGRPVLIGTRTIDVSEVLSQKLFEAGLNHVVLNARQLEKEAEIVAQAGLPHRITVATNMAGRGTDIKLDPKVAEMGGLHVILTELHESPRIDRQLIGRCARQGDPGSYQIFVSDEDELLTIASHQGLGGVSKRTVSMDPLGVHRQAQRFVERRKLLLRTAMLQQERKRQKMLMEMGLDPLVDSLDD